MIGNASISSTRSRRRGRSRRSSHALDLRCAKAFAKNDPARIEHVEPHLAGLALEEGRQLDDLDTGEPAFEKLRASGNHAAAVVHRDDDLVDRVLALTHE